MPCSKAAFELLPSLIQRLRFANWPEETENIVKSLTLYFVRMGTFCMKAARRVCLLMPFAAFIHR